MARAKPDMSSLGLVQNWRLPGKVNVVDGAFQDLFHKLTELERLWPSVLLPIMQAIKSFGIVLK